MKLIKKFIKYFKTMWSNYKLNRLNKKLNKVAHKKTKERLQLRYDISMYIRKLRNMDKDDVSKYIPWNEETKAKVRYNVEKKFGEQMQKLNVKLNKKMQIV